MKAVPNLTSQKTSVTPCTLQQQPTATTLSQEKPNQASSSQKESNTFRWPEKDVLLLLTCYEKFEARFQKKSGKKKLYGKMYVQR